MEKMRGEGREGEVRSEVKGSSKREESYLKDVRGRKEGWRREEAREEE